MNWWRGNKWRLLILAALLALLIVAVVWHGVTAPGSPDPEASVTGSPTLSPTPMPTAAATPTAGPTPSIVAPPTASLTPSATPSPAVSPAQAAPSPTAIPSPTQAPQTDALSCTISISCSALLDHWEDLSDDKQALVPPDGWLLSPTQVEFETGESVFDVLQRICREQGLHMEFSSTPLYPSAYIEGIGNLYEFDCGPLSGWSYTVNDQKPNYSCVEYTLENGDVICWQYLV